MTEQTLSGGNLNRVVRVGDTVRRPMQPWSPTTHGLLAHLEAQHFSGCPRFLGVDQQGREILSFLDGETGFVPYRWDEDVLVAAARLLRSYHDATASYSVPTTAQWQVSYPDPARYEVICHNDFAPYNLVFENGIPYALIDFDLAGPGPRLRDLAQGAYWFAPLSFRADDMSGKAFADMEDDSRRLKRFCEAYGTQPSRDLLDMVAEVLQFLWRFPHQQVESGQLEYQSLIDDGHTEHWKQELEAFREHREGIERNL